MIVSPHAGLAPRNGAAIRTIVPAIGSMIDRVQEQTLMLGIRAQIWLLEKRAADGQPRLPITIVIETVSEAK
jgi:hypothetical protein